VEAVREWLERDVMNGADGSVRFNARVAVNCLAMVERELALGAAHADAHARRLAELGATDDADLAAQIRAGRLDGRAEEVRRLVWESVRDKLAVANPRYLEQPDARPPGGRPPGG
jgi:alcohol dehydrogenase class IV